MSPDPAPRGQMPTTHWTLLRRLDTADPEGRRLALEELCQTYHYPLYCQIRRRGLDHHDAEDALHDFLGKLLRQDSFSTADAEKGRLRTYLLTALQRFLATRHQEQSRRQDREISLEARSAIAAAAERYDNDAAAHEESPDRLYDRQWAQELMRQVLHRLRSRYEVRGKARHFDVLLPVLQSGGSLREEDSSQLAERLGLRPGALRMALLRLLRDYRTLLQEEILQTVQDRDQAQAELAALKSCF